MKKMLFIMNPCAGTKKANRYFIRIVELFNRAGYRVTTHVTQEAGDATKVTRELAGEVDVVVCCGGDGTFNETVSGVMAAGSSTPIGYIPAGSTNDFAASLELPTGILAAARNIVDGHPVQYDMGLFNNRYFSYVASFGAFTKASYATPQSVKNALGHTAYLLSGISELSQIRKIHAKLELDGEKLEGEYLFGAVCNSTSVAGLLTLDKTVVDLQDGKFEVLLIRAPEHLSELNECIKAIQSKTYDCKMMTFRSASNVVVTMDRPVDWTLDGEYQPGFPTVHLQNRHLAISLLTKKERL